MDIAWNSLLRSIYAGLFSFKLVSCSVEIVGYLYQYWSFATSLYSTSYETFLKSVSFKPLKFMSLLCFLPKHIISLVAYEHLNKDHHSDVSDHSLWFQNDNHFLVLDRELSHANSRHFLYVAFRWLYKKFSLHIIRSDVQFFRSRRKFSERF